MKRNLIMKSTHTEVIFMLHCSEDVILFQNINNFLVRIFNFKLNNNNENG